MSIPPASGLTPELGQGNNNAAIGTRTLYTPSFAGSFGSFIPQESYYGNTFIPVLPRLEPNPTPHTSTSTTVAPTVASTPPGVQM